MSWSLWPQSLFGRLIAASIVALLVAQAVSMVMIARERERFVLQSSVREWSRRIAEVTGVLQGLDDTERSTMAARLSERPWRFGHRPPDVFMYRDGLVNGPDGDLSPPGAGFGRGRNGGGFGAGGGNGGGFGAAAGQGGNGAGFGSAGAAGGSRGRTERAGASANP